MAVAAESQTNIYEVVIEDDEVEAALEKRQKAKESASAVNKRYREADAEAKALVNRLDLGVDAPVRVGRFVVSLRSTKSRSVSFETAAGERLTIRKLEEPDS